MNYIEMKKEAARLGINSFGVGKHELAKLIEAKMHTAPEGVEEQAPESEAPRQQEPIIERGRGDEVVRTIRVPLSGKQSKLGVESLDPNYKYRFVQDDKRGRVKDFERAGYELVKKKDGTYDSRVTGTHKDGTPRHDFLMRQKKEYYEEDQRAKEAAIKEKEKAAVVTPGDGNFRDVNLHNSGSSFSRMG